MSANLVDPDVTREKFRSDFERWTAIPDRNARGWLLLDYNEEQFSLEIAFLGALSISSGSAPLPIVACAIRLTYENYDLWPPSLTFIDAFTRQPAKPHVAAVVPTPEGPRNVLIENHPATQRPFLCLPGIREYHSHPQHTGDDWLLHRGSGAGSPSVVCERVWRFMTKNIAGLQVVIQAQPGWPLRALLQVLVAQNVEAAPTGVPSSGPGNRAGELIKVA
jgi:hypothetical protein